MTAVRVPAEPDETTTFQSPWASLVPTDILIGPLVPEAIIGPPLPGLAPVATGAAAGANVPVPPLARIWPSCVPARQLAGERLEGLSAIGAGGGSPSPNSLVTVGGVSSVRPVASVIANVSPVKQVPLVTIVKPAPTPYNAFAPSGPPALRPQTPAEPIPPPRPMPMGDAER